jgi:hypothetical protein
MEHERSNVCANINHQRASSSCSSSCSSSNVPLLGQTLLLLLLLLLLWVVLPKCPQHLLDFVPLPAPTPEWPVPSSFSCQISGYDVTS